MGNVKEMIIDFVEREYQLPQDVDYNTFDLMENGYIDSMRRVVFVTLLEEEYNIEFTSDELLSDDFRTINGLEKLVERKISNKE